MKRLFIMLIAILLLTGCSSNNADTNNISEDGKATIKGDSQTVIINVNPGSYQDITVQKGIPVKFNLKVTKENLNSCNNAIIIKEWNITKDLTVGDNVVEFTPTEIGTFNYSCWMNMIVNKIIVVDDLNNTNDIQDNIENSGLQTKAMSCGGCSMMNRNKQNGGSCH